MNKKPTPETDDVTMQLGDRLARAYTFHGTEPFKYSIKELVPAEFARKLERERDEARNQTKQWFEEWHLTDKAFRDTKAERDEWAAMCGRYKQERDQAQETLKTSKP